MWTTELVVMAVMIALNGVFAGYEIALASVGVMRLEILAQKGTAGAAAALRMKRGMEGSLAVVQLGITLVGAVAAATGGAGAGKSIAPLLRDWGLAHGVSEFLAIVLVVVPLTVATIILGELVPKVFALRNTEWVCLRLSRPMEWFSFAVWPAVWFFETTTGLIMRWGERWWKPAQGAVPVEASLHELRAAAAVARTERLIGQREEGIIVSAARLSRTAVRDIALPIDFIVMLGADCSLAEALVTAHQDMHTRFPVTERPGDPRRIIGYANFKDIVSTLRVSPGEPSLRAVVRPLPSFDAETSVAHCLEKLIREHTHIALVRAAGGQVLGMITMEDILEELVGEIHDEYDRLPAHIVPAGRGWFIGGSATLEQIERTTGLALEPEGARPVHTLNDWVVGHLGRPARGGELLTTDSAEILIRKVRRQLVQEAHLSEIRPERAEAISGAREGRG
jgi:putative hemolysin